MEVNNNSKNDIVININYKDGDKIPTIQDADKKRSSRWDEKVNGKIFIVYGHDHAIRGELKDYIQNTLNLPKPVILDENLSPGLTIIENFEKFAEKTGLVFVLLTPDDFAENSERARQNVIFELGYFMGKLGRKSGRIIILYKGNVEIPSDLSGLLYIRIDNGIMSAGEQIRAAIKPLYKGCE